MDDTIKPITRKDIKRGLLTGKVRLVSDPFGCVMCSIGNRDCCFYFGGMAAKGVTPWQYATEMDFDEIVDDIVDTLYEFEREFTDEWEYCRYVLNND